MKKKPLKFEKMKETYNKDITKQKEESTKK